MQQGCRYAAGLPDVFWGCSRTFVTLFFPAGWEPCLIGWGLACSPNAASLVILFSSFIIKSNKKKRKDLEPQMWFPKEITSGAPKIKIFWKNIPTEPKLSKQRLKSARDALRFQCNPSLHQKCTRTADMMQHDCRYAAELPMRVTRRGIEPCGFKCSPRWFSLTDSMFGDSTCQTGLHLKC